MNPNEPTKPPEVPPAAPKITVEARARYDDDVPPAPKPVSPERVRKPTVVEKAAPVAPVVVDRPSEVKEVIGDMPASSGFDPSPTVSGSPSRVIGFVNTLMAVVGFVIFLPVAIVIFLAIDCAMSGNGGGKW